MAVGSLPGADPFVNPGGSGNGAPMPPQNGGIPFAPGTPQYTAQGGDSGYAPTPFQQGMNTLLGYNGPTLDQYNNNAGNGYQNIAYGQALYGINQSTLQNQYAMQSGDLNTQMAVNSLQAQRARADAAAYGQMMGYNTDVFNAQAAGLGNNAQHQLADINSQAVANGAFTSQGANNNRGFAAKDFFDQYGALWGNFNQQQSMLGMRQGNANIAGQVLDREAQNLGMKSGMLQTTLQDGLAKLGLQNQISVGNLLNGIQNNNLQAQQLLYQIVTQAGQWQTASGG